jgi:hypothetical protein
MSGDSSVAGAILPAATTRCQDGGPELLPVQVAASTGSVIDFVVMVCKANARVQIHLGNQLLADQTGTSEVPLRLPPLGPGFHLLFWSVITNSPEWQTRDEVSVNGVTVFRRRKNSRGANPVNAGFLFIQVS